MPCPCSLDSCKRQDELQTGKLLEPLPTPLEGHHQGGHRAPLAEPHHTCECTRALLQASNLDERVQKWSQETLARLPLRLFSKMICLPLG